MLATIVIGAVLPAAMVRVELLTIVLAAFHDGFLTAAAVIAAAVACTVHGADAAADHGPATAAGPGGAGRRDSAMTGRPSARPLK